MLNCSVQYCGASKAGQSRIELLIQGLNGVICVWKPLAHNFVSSLYSLRTLHVVPPPAPRCLVIASVDPVSLPNSSRPTKSSLTLAPARPRCSMYTPALPCLESAVVTPRILGTIRPKKILAEGRHAQTMPTCISVIDHTAVPRLSYYVPSVCMLGVGGKVNPTVKLWDFMKVIKLFRRKMLTMVTIRPTLNMIMI